MKLAPYSDYKDSGVPWVGKVPAHWETIKLKMVSKVQTGITLGKTYERVELSEYPYLCVANVQNGFLNLRRIKTVDVPEKEASKTKLYQGDVIVTEGGDIDKLGRGSVWKGEIDNCLHQNHIFAIRPDNDRLSPQFLAKILESFHGRSYFYLTAKKTTNLAVTNQKTLGLLPLLLPAIDEQKTIVRFLEWKTAQINKFIRNKRRLIELLKEHKQNIINQAVTRGLDPNVKFKPSGVEWIGDIPEHWTVCRLRNVVSHVTSGSRGWSSYASDDGPLFIRVANLDRGSLNLKFEDVIRLNLPSISETERTKIEPGDILLSITAYIGSVAVAPSTIGEAYVSQHVARCKTRCNDIYSKWLGYVLLSEVGQTHGKLSLYGGTKDGLSLDDVKNYPILMPPRQEQIAIVNRTEEKIAKIDQAISRAQREIELMREYRTRMISDVVTGKVDVRGIEVPEVAEEELLALEEDTSDADDVIDDEGDLDETD
ncbi:MAG: restriction endonuclease subunit S [Deltaproteobacteria bacterium]|nr:restriction endonuclease subunit S [Deltaproteobacteria bacterium]